ncbi:MAG: dephospho-CoA kinase [Dehalococcoidia bacterium]|nr:dephospho-CoA kinase [Dehalococcoidia bacterium]
MVRGISPDGEALIVIGLTGGILSGKSTVANMLKKLGATIIDADKVGHEAYRPDTETWREVVAAFGENILQPDREIDRRKLAQIVFNDPQALQKLNGIMHPRMFQMMKDKIEALRREEKTDVLVLEAAILIEANWIPLADQVWVTAAPEETVIQRLVNRNGLTEEQARARIKSQLSSAERARHADVVIDTNCTLAEVEDKVKKLWADMKKELAADVG